MAAAYSESRSVFGSRLKLLGLNESHCGKILANVDGLKKPDETLLMTVLKDMLEEGRPALAGRWPSRSGRSASKKQRAKLTGLTIQGFSEPSDALVDLAVLAYEANELRYVAWERCASRQFEV